MTITMESIIVKENLPCWSLPMIINGDSSGLNDEEIRMVEGWINFYAERRAESWHVSVPNDAEGSFNSRPAFGLPCDCIECDIVMMNVTIKR